MILDRALKFQSTAVIMEDQFYQDLDQDLLDAINIGEKYLWDTINIDEPLDISLVGIKQNTAVGII